MWFYGFLGLCYNHWRRKYITIKGVQMESRESIKDDVEQEFKFILHSQKNRKKVAIVGNLKSIRCTFTCPQIQCGTIVNYKAVFNVVLCLLSNGNLLPPFILTTLDCMAMCQAPVVVGDPKFTLASFNFWLTHVWRKRNIENVQSLMVTSMHLPSGVAKLLKRHNTELIMMPDIAAELEPLNEVWSKEFINEITKMYRVWGLKFNTVSLTVNVFCGLVHKAWIKCSKAANFDKLLLVDEGQEIASILEEEIFLEKERMRHLPCIPTIDIFEVYRCVICYNLFHIEECERHSLIPHGNDGFHKYRRLIGMGSKLTFSCFIEKEDGTLVCEICATEFPTEYLASYHLLKHLQQKWCRICLRQLFNSQEHICLQNESGLEEETLIV